MPWTVAVVDLRSVSPPEPQDARAVFFSRRLASQADGARRSQSLRAPLISALRAQRVFARSPGTVLRVSTRGCACACLRIRGRRQARGKVRVQPTRTAHVRAKRR